MLFEERGSCDGASENAVAKAGSEAFDLVFDLERHVYVRAVFNVAVSPERVFSGRCARRVKDCGLGKNDERLFRRSI